MGAGGGAGAVGAGGAAGGAAGDANVSVNFFFVITIRDFLTSSIIK